MRLVSRSLSVHIERPASQVYEYFCQPQNLSRWSAQWIGQTAPGPTRWHFSERNAFGVLDFALHPPRGASIYIQLRVAPNEGRCSLLLTLFGRAGMSEEECAAVAGRAARELLSVKLLLEGRLEKKVGLPAPSVRGDGESEARDAVRRLGDGAA
jgi:hypothetical protein